MKKMLKEKKAQLSIEYLLLFGGVIVVALFIGLALKSLLGDLQGGAVTELETATQG